ncbi:uncharacterized protein LOC120353850 [Nilaparvata lugens]|uniref:uncharacterized protein LOC120353850 n=1 Tax=Nilaparvata lugens TaxID=108931 RepID=UPI00193D1721|nr:uncharacterized protein LOC120353850 [Nilaparvata lugens]
MPNQSVDTAPSAATPVLRKEFLDMIPEFSGEPLLLNRFVSICDKVVAKFFVQSNPDDFQNEYLFSTIISRLKGRALELVTSGNTYAWPEVRRVLLDGYLDKRDCFTLNIEMTELKQESSESPFHFHERIQKILNLQLAYFLTKMAANSTILCEYAKQLALRVFLRGLNEPIGSLMRTKNPSSLSEALSMITNEMQYKNRNSNYNFNLNKRPISQPFQQLPLTKQIQHFPHTRPMQNFPQNKTYPNFQNQSQQRPMITHQNSNQQFRNFSSMNQQRPMFQRQFFGQQHRPQMQSQPTPMSISTRNTELEPPKKNPRFNQLTTEFATNNDELLNTNRNELLTDNFSNEPFNYPEMTGNLMNNFENLELNDDYNNQMTSDQTEQNHFLGETSLGTNFQL